MENLRLTRNGNLKINGVGASYYEYDACMECSDPYLGQRRSKFCNPKCKMHGENNHSFGKKKPDHSERMRGNKFGSKGEYCGIPTYDKYTPRLEWLDQCRRSPSDLNILEVRCTYCDKWYTPKLQNVWNRINEPATNRFYCSDECKQRCPIFGQQKYPKNHKLYPESRSHQQQLKLRTFNKDEGLCQICGIDVTPETSICHHEVPVAINGLISLDDDNAWTLCFVCDKHAHSLPGCSYSEIKKKAIKLMECKNETK